MLKEPLISIIVPVYNVEKYLDQCIKSIVNQTYKNLEIILVDDGSSDNSPHICDEWAKKDNRIKVIHKENSGVSAARNVGLDKAAGEYIGFIDSDDYIEKDMYSTMLCAILESGAKMACCESKLIPESCNEFSIKKAKPTPPKNLKTEDLVSEIFAFRVGTAVWCRLMHKTVLEGIRFPEGEKNEDYPIIIPITHKAEGGVILIDPLYYYRDRTDSITATLHQSLKTLRFVKTNLARIEKQIEKYGLKGVKNFPLFASKNSYYMLITMAKNHKIIEGESKELYDAYLEITKKYKWAFFGSPNVKIKDKILFFLILTNLYKKLFKNKGV